MGQTNHFDQAAARWDEEPRRVALARRLAAAIAERVPLTSEWTALDFGCGTGLVTVELAPRVGRIVGLDSSQGMIDVLRQKTEALGLVNLTVERGELETAPLPLGGFDLIVSAMAMHHVRETAAVLKRFSSLLRPGGFLAVADLDAEDGSFHSGSTEPVPHNGFARETLGALVEAAGFVTPDFITAHLVNKPTAAGEMREYPVFLMTARKG